MFKKSFSVLILTSAGLILSGCIGAAVVGGAAAGSAAGSNLSFGTQVDDIAIKAKAINAMNQFPGMINKSNVEITVFDHIVLLLGQVPNETYRHDVASAVAKIHNVRVVFNKLTVGPPVTFRTYAHDAWITTKVKAAFIGKVNPAAFDVVTENGTVYILGLTTPANGQVAADTAAQIGGVKSVVKAFYYMPTKPQKAAIKDDIK